MDFEQFTAQLMYFNAKAKESVDDKVKRMIRGEVRAGNISESSGN